MTRALCLTILLGAAWSCRSGKLVGMEDGQLVATPLVVAYTAVYVRSRGLAELYSWDTDFDAIAGVSRIEP